MRILVLDHDTAAAREACGLLSAQGLSPRAASDVGGALMAAGSEPPDAVLINLDLGLGQVSTFLASLRSGGPGATAKVLLSSGTLTEDASDVNLLAQTFNTQGFLARPLSADALRAALGAPASAPTAAPRRQDSTQAPADLSVLIRAWRGRETGFLRVGRGEIIGALIRGALPRGSEVAPLRRALGDSEALQFTPGEVGGQPDRQLLPPLLWERALADAEPSFGDAHRRDAVALRADLSELKTYPLSRATLRLLRSADGRLRLERHVQALGVGVEDVGRELDALQRLGLISVKPRAAASKRSSTPARAAQSSAQASRSRRQARAPQRPARAPQRSQAPPRRQPQRPPPSSPQDAKSATDALMTLKRLRRELAHLKAADCWTVLGIPGTDDGAKIDGAARRMTRRYKKIAQHEGYSQEIGRMAREIIALVEQARVRATERGAPSMPEDNEGRAFQAGLDASRRGQWDQAARAFRTAHHSKIDEARYMAHLGHALFQQSLSAGAGKAAALRQEALDTLELCDSWDSELPQGQAWLAEVEVATGELKRARARLARLERAKPGAIDLTEIHASLREAEAEAP